MLIAWNDSHGRRYGEVIENLHATFVRELRSARGQLCYVFFKVVAELVVVKAHAKAVVFPRVEKAMCKQCDASVTLDRIGSLRRKAKPTEYAYAIDHLSGSQLFCNGRRVVLHKKVLREVCDRKSTFVLLIDDEALVRGEAKKIAYCQRNLRRRDKRSEWVGKIRLWLVRPIQRRRKLTR